VFENRVLWRIFKPRRDEVTEGCRTPRNQELHNSNSSLSIIRTINIRRKPRARHLAWMGENRNALGYWLKGQTDATRKT
jgi:hypothetical protein